MIAIINSSGTSIARKQSRTNICSLNVSVNNMLAKLPYALIDFVVSESFRILLYIKSNIPAVILTAICVVCRWQFTSRNERPIYATKRRTNHGQRRVNISFIPSVKDS